MDARSTDLDPAAKAAGPSAPKWAAATSPQGKWRTRPRLKLIAALRGEGVLVSPDHTLPVTYELDMFGVGTQRSVSGNLEGDFSALLAGGESAEGGGSEARLRLADGREFDIDLHGFERFAVSFDATGASVEDALVPILRA